MKTTTIRPEQPNDHAAISEINRLAFGQENEGKLIAAIRNAEGFDPSLSLVTICNGQAVGHILFSPIHIETDHGDVPAIALAPMAVLPNRQKQGIGSAMVRDGLDACRQAGHRIVIVLGHADYYPRFGLTPAGARGLRPPFPAPDEAFMAMALVPGALDNISGIVRYPAAFDDV